MTTEQLEKLRDSISSYEIQKQEDEYGYWVEDCYADIDDVINNPDYYRIIMIVH